MDEQAKGLQGIPSYTLCADNIILVDETKGDLSRKLDSQRKA